MNVFQFLPTRVDDFWPDQNPKAMTPDALARLNRVKVRGARDGNKPGGATGTKSRKN